MRLPPQRSIVIGVLYAVLAAAFCWPLFSQPHGLGAHDWDVHLFFHGAVLKNLVEYGQLPFWNPWNCGGNVMWQNPQIAALSPVYPLTLLVSLPLAVKVNIVLHYWLAFVGMHLLLSRIIGLSFLPVVIYLASVFTLAGGHALHLAVGHSNFLPAFYLPLLLFFFCRALGTGAVRDVLPASALLALMIFNGGLHIVPMAIGGVGVFSLVSAAGGRSWRPVLIMTIFAVGGLALGAPKLLPMAVFVTGDQFFDARSVVERPDSMTLEMVLRTYLDPYQTRGLRFDLQRHGWFEYGNYIGLLAALLIAGSVLWAFVGRRAPNRGFGVAAAVATLVLLVLSAGEFSAWAPASVATHLPLFSNFRIPSRYTIAAVLFGIVTAGWAVRSAMADGAPSTGAKALVGLVCVLATADLLATNRAQLRDVFVQAPISTRFRLLGGPGTLAVDRDSDPYRPGSPMFRTLMSGRSFFNCYEVMRLTPTANPDQPLVFSDGKSKIFETRFSPNRVEFGVTVGNEPSRVFMNQNFSDGWRADAGPLVRDPESGKPSLVLPAGWAGRVAFTFIPPQLILGAIIGVLALAVSLFATIRDVRLPSAR